MTQSHDPTQIPAHAIADCLSQMPGQPNGQPRAHHCITCALICITHPMLTRKRHEKHTTQYKSVPLQTHSDCTAAVCLILTTSQPPSLHFTCRCQRAHCQYKRILPTVAAAHHQVRQLPQRVSGTLHKASLLRSGCRHGLSAVQACAWPHGICICKAPKFGLQTIIRGELQLRLRPAARG